MKLFYLDRSNDVAGVSGVGRVAEGVQFEDGQCILRWYNTGSVTLFHTLADLEKVHCQGIS